MLGGGYFVSQNKVIPGSYINFVSLNNASANLADRGVVAMAMELNWGDASKIIEVTNETITKDCFKVFGYEYGDASLKDIREVMLHATKLLLYRLNGAGVKASNTFGAAKYAGTRGNAIKTVIAVNADDSSKWDVSTYVDTTLVDKQVGVASAAALVDNDYFDFDKTATLAATTGTSCTGGTNSSVTGTNHSDFMALLEEQTYNIICTTSTDGSVKALYVAFTKRMVEECGIRIQAVLYNQAADHECIINEATAANLVPWLAGAEAGCALNKSLTNTTYDGENTISTSYTQSQLEDAINAGKIVFHKVGDAYNVLRDINSLVTLTDDKGSDFQSNQTVRVINQIGNDIAVLFNTRYLGKVPNDAEGRTSFWSALVDYFNQLRQMRAIEVFTPNTDITVEAGEQKNSVVVNTNITPVSCMEILYMTVVVS